MTIPEIINLLGCVLTGAGILLVVVNSPIKSSEPEEGPDKKIVKVGYFLLYLGAAIIIAVSVPMTIILLSQGK
jgi:hypothetical protein